MTVKLSRTTTRRAAGLAKKKTRICLAGYTRLSEDRNDDKMGYDIQREAIERYAAAYDYDILWYQDKDITAGDKDVVRPDYERMLVDLKAGVVSGIVVWRLDRLVRLTREFERCFGIVEDAGGFIVDVYQKFSTDTETGKLIMRLLVIMAEMEIASMKARQKAHQKRKAEDGKYKGGGYRPFGFEGTVRDPKTKRILNEGRVGVAHVPDEAALMVKAAAEILDGKSFGEIAREWADAEPPVTGTNGACMSSLMVKRVLTSPRAAGLREFEEYDEVTDEYLTHLVQAEWNPIIDRETWDSLRALDKWSGVAQNRGTSYLLSGGLLRCECGSDMVGAPRRHWKTKEKIRQYRCNPSMAARARGACGGPTISALEVETHAEEWVLGRLQNKPDLIELLKPAEPTGSFIEHSAALARVGELEGKLRGLVRRGELPEGHPDWLAKVEREEYRQIWLAQLSEALTVVERASKEIAFPMPTPEEQEDLEGYYGSLTPTQKRAFLGAVLREVRVSKAVRHGSKLFDTSRVEIFFADAKEPNAHGERGRVGEVDGNALLAADALDIEGDVSAGVGSGVGHSPAR